MLVNNAGICLVTPFLNIEADEWDTTLATNLTGAFYVAQEVCRHMVRRRRGVVLNMSSKNGLDGEFGHSALQRQQGRADLADKNDRH